MTNKRATFTILLVAASVWTTPVCAQRWNDTRALELVRQATDRRAQQLADSGLADYRAIAHGYLTFLAQLGEGFREPPQVVKADELALQLYWRAPSLSKQIIVGRRDTTLLPTDIAYHRDHLGIVQNNFPDIIRLGDGDEVRDVPHPLSASGIGDYDFALADSLRIQIPGRAINVYEVKVRPKDDRQPRIIGAVYIDRDDAQVVRMAFSFTRVAFLDKYLENVFIVLENGLVGTRFWLPRHQEIEIRRTTTWLDYPVRGIIRGRWEISDYDINASIPLATFAGPEIVQAPPEQRANYEWPSARILDSLPPDVRAITADEIRRVQAEARALVREEALQRTRNSALSARGVSDLARFNRVEGTALGGGLIFRFGGGMSLAATGRYGLDDRAAKGRGQLQWQSARGITVRAYAARELREAGIVAERSGFINSMASQEFASDYTDLFRVDAFGGAISLPKGNWTWTLDVAQERHARLAIHAVAASGRFRAPMLADSIDRLRSVLISERRLALSVFGFDTRARLEAWAEPNRFTFDAESSRPMGRLQLGLRSIGGVHLHLDPAETSLGSARVSFPQQDLLYFGGPITAPGYDFHSFSGDAGIAQRVEVRVPVPFIPLSLGRFGRSPASMTLAPFVSALAIHDSYQADGVYSSVGLGVLYFFDIIRFDVARGLRGGRWMFSADVNRIFWSVL
jgi:hypothetical protein